MDAVCDGAEAENHDELHRHDEQRRPHRHAGPRMNLPEKPRRGSKALRARACGELLAAEGDRAGALVELRSALRTWLSLEAPLAAAQTRCRIADLLNAEGERESAAVELEAAVTAFEQAGADGLLRQCRQLNQRHLPARRGGLP